MFDCGPNRASISENFGTRSAALWKVCMAMAILPIDGRGALDRQFRDLPRLAKVTGVHRATVGRPRAERSESHGEAARQALSRAGGEDRARARVPSGRGGEAHQGD